MKERYRVTGCASFLSPILQQIAKNEELIRQAEDRRKEAEKMKKEAEEKENEALRKRLEREKQTHMEEVKSVHY